MPRISALNLTTYKEDPNLQRVWLITGEDSLLRQRALRFLQDQFLSPEEQEFNQEVINGAETSANEVIAQATTLPFLAACRVVVVRNVESIAAAEQTKIAEGFERLPPSTRLILIKAKSEDKPGKESRGKSSLESRAAEHGMVVECSAPTRDALKAWVMAEVKQRGSKIEPVAAGLLCELIGPDLARLSMEIEKMVLYMDEAPAITKNLVQKMVQKTSEETVFRLTDAVAEKKAAAALNVLDELMSEADSAYAIIGMLTRQFRLITQARWLMGLGFLPGPADRIPGDVTARLPKMHNILPVLKGQSWLANKLIQQARIFSDTDVSRAFNRLLQTDLALKGIEEDYHQSGVSEPRMAMQLLILDLCRSGNS